MRPSERMSPISVTPVTSAENSSGTISMKISDRNSWPKGLVIPCTTTSTTRAQYHAGSPATQPAEVRATGVHPYNPVSYTERQRVEQDTSETVRVDSGGTR